MTKANMENYYEFDKPSALKAALELLGLPPAFVIIKLLDAEGAKLHEFALRDGEFHFNALKEKRERLTLRVHKSYISMAMEEHQRCNCARCNHIQAQFLEFTGVENNHLEKFLAK